MSTDIGPGSGSTSRRAPGLRITLDDIAAILEEASRRAGQAPAAQSIVAGSAPVPDNAELVQRLAALAGELRDINARLNPTTPAPPPSSP